jgi:hypothetical protein
MDSGGSRINLTGALAGAPGSFEAHKYPTVVGLLDKCPLGKEITLLNCLQTRFSLSVPGFTSEELHATKGYVGAQLTHAKDLVFPKIRIELSRLPDWVHRSGLTRPEFLRDQKGPKGVDVSYRFPEKTTVDLGGSRVSVSFGMTVSHATPRELVLRENVFFEVEVDDPQTHDELHGNFGYPLQNLLTLATDHPNAVVRQTVFRDSEEQRGASGRANPIHVVGQPVYWESEVTKRLLPHNMLFTMRDVEDQFEQVLRSWMRFWKECPSFCEFFFGDLYMQEVYLDTRLLHAMHSLLLYYRLRCGDAVTDENDRITVVLGSAPAEHRQWLRERLMLDEELGLCRALRELLSKHREVLEPLIGTNAEEFSREVVSVRNYVVHGAPGGSEREDRGERWFSLLQILMVLVKCCLLEELGIPEKTRREWFRRNAAYLHLKSQCQA